MHLSLVQKLKTQWFKFFNEPTSGLNLAIFRIIVFSCLFFGIDQLRLTDYLSLSVEFIDASAEIGWLAPLLLPLKQVLILNVVFKVFCVFAILGVFTRSSAFITTTMAVYLIGIQYLFGRIFHSHHHLIWFGWLLAVSPCGDFLSVDRWIAEKGLKKKRIEIGTLSRIYSRPIRMAWLLYGIIYLFPGIYKLILGGPEWIFSDNLLSKLKAFQFGWGQSTGLEWLFNYAWVFNLMALAIVLFELSFIFAIFWQRARALYVVIGIIFHSLVSRLMFLPFYELRLAYVVFFNWQKIFGIKTVSTSPESESDGRQIRVITLMGCLLLLINSVYGIQNKWGWPFTTYPSYHKLWKDEAPFEYFDIQAFGEDGVEIPVQDALGIYKKKINLVHWYYRAESHLVRASEESRLKELRLIWQELLKIQPNLERAKSLHLIRRNLSPQLPPLEIVLRVDPSIWR